MGHRAAGAPARGHFLLSRNPAAYWRARAKADGGTTYGRVVNTSSEAFLLGPAGQPNYAAAKAGIVALTLATARGLARYGVRANVICPRTRTAMTADVFGDPPEGTDPLPPEHVATLVTYLARRPPTAAGFSSSTPGWWPPAVEQRFDRPAWTLEELDTVAGGYVMSRNEDLCDA